MSDQWIRKAGLILVSGEQALDLSAFHLKFNVHAAQVESPNHAAIRVYNLSSETVKQVQGEFSRVVLNAGYENGNYGVIFDGTIKQFRIGRENATDTYLDILASDGDLGYNFGLINKTLAKGTTLAQQAAVVSAAMPEVAPVDDKALAASQIKVSTLNFPSIRGAVLFGLPRIHMRNLARTLNAAWSIQNGAVVLQSNLSYLPGEVVVLTSATGLVDVPEQTDGGISIRCLLNPRLRVGGRVALDNAYVNTLINQRSNLIAASYDSPYAVQNLAPISDDGTYMIFAIDYDGDTRGQPWYAMLTCLAMDVTAPAATAVAKEAL